MAKRFKLKFSRVITSFNSCRSKDPSTFPSNPVPSFLGLSSVKPHLPPPSKSSSIKRHMSSAFASITSGFRSRSTTARYLSETDHTKSPPPPPTPEFHWEREDKWHVVAKMYDENPRRKVCNTLVSCEFENDSIFLPPPPPPNTERTKRRRIKKKKKTMPRIRVSSSSTDSGLFSSEGLDDDNDPENGMGNEETETLVSSTKSFSTDYSSPDQFGTHLETIRESPFNRISNRKKRVKRAKRYVNRKARKSIDESQSSPARLSRFQWLIPCTVEGKVRESFAVVKKSEDPYKDFKRSMMEMILEKQMYEVNDLEQLLQCFLSLNSRRYHGIIIEAFSEIWEDLFCKNSIKKGVPRSV
ncbi:transcription repressor OFP7 [Manihot esculenta]|uniref:Transcription repressor n=1 Tax=Manihot esculenta TaxID=3983 RepID=A0A2C9WKL1_MANES|nr:transcription repressor OFP7 [Manihot esculenta]OAY60715.1 hypothetical protein MANES_01G133500v8 [Manihot esculenta]